MQYMLVLTRGEWEDSASPEEQQPIWADIREWWDRMVGQGKIAERHQLQSPHSAKTVVLGADRESTVADGPFSGAKEQIGGYGILEAADVDEAIAIARTYPSPSSKVEVRPVVQR